MRTKAEKRIAHWMVDFRRWAEKSGMANPHSKDDYYFAGVVLAISVSQGKTAAPNDVDGGSSMEWARGYHDGIALLNKVIAYGDAPKGDFRDLLGAPYSKPLGGG